MTTEITSFASDIITIKYCLYALLALIAVSAINNIIRTYFYIKKELRGIRENSFKDAAHDLIERGEYDKVIKMSEEKLSTHKNHPYANYTLALSNYMQNNYEKAHELFKKTIHIHPAWEKDFVGPYITKIEETLKTQHK